MFSFRRDLLSCAGVLDFLLSWPICCLWFKVDAVPVLHRSADAEMDEGGNHRALAGGASSGAGLLRE